MPFTNNSTRIRVNQTAIAIVWSLAILCLAINCGNSDGNHTSFTANGGAPNLGGGSALGGVQALGGSSTVGGSPADTDGGIIGGSGEVCTGPIGIADAADTILVDGSSPGRNFEFIGGLSGGGGTSRLLYDYPSAQQSEILDYLFKPGYGASLQMLKVEIGADTDSTNGAEASHQRSSTDQNYNRGYEWWLMKQAKARNPKIKFYGLEWGAPGWFSGGFFSQDNINYIVNWIQNAHTVHGLTIDYIGGWNENGYYAPWVESLKQALVSHGLTTQVVAADAAYGWGVATDMKNDAAFNAAVDVVGSHYVCGYLSQATDCGSAPNLADALFLGKPLWASEDGSLPFDDGAIALARSYNRHYIQARITGSINWSVVGSWYANLPYGGVDGLLYANQPWSGNYKVDRAIWATAHTTQFVEPGWQYLDSGSALASGIGSYVALRSPNGKDYSLILETLDTGLPHTLNVEESGGVFSGPIHVWATDMAARTSSAWFIQQPDIVPVDCGYTFTALPNHVYTLTTTQGQGKGATKPPAHAALSLPLTDDFESYTVGAMPNIPKYFSTVQGAFEVENCLGGRAGKCLEQEITVAPTKWGSVGSPNPLTIVGDPGWKDYRVSTDALLEQSGWLELMGRITAQIQSSGAVLGYHLQIADSGTWTLFTQDANMNNNSLATGTVIFPLNSWHTLALDFSGTTVTALFDNAPLATVTDSTYTTGNAGLGVKPWNRAQFDKFTITGQSTSSDAGSTNADAGNGGPTPVCMAHPPPVDANGVSVITAFSNVTADAGAGAATWFGSWTADASGFGGGSYSYPGMGPGTDIMANPSAGIYCTTLSSQNSFVATATPGTGLVISGQVSTFSGIGFYLYHCVDASAFHGIQFSISGDVGNELVSNMGAPNQLTLSVGTLPDDKVGSGLGMCTLPGCAAPSYSFTVPAQPTTIRVTWEMLTGGAPIYVLDPKGISGLSWSFPWPCTTNVTPYTTHITITNVAFF